MPLLAHNSRPSHTNIDAEGAGRREGPSSTSLPTTARLTYRGSFRASPCVPARDIAARSHARRRHVSKTEAVAPGGCREERHEPRLRHARLAPGRHRRAGAHTSAPSASSMSAAATGPYLGPGRPRPSTRWPARCAPRGRRRRYHHRPSRFLRDFLTSEPQDAASGSGFCFGARGTGAIA